MILEPVEDFIQDVIAGRNEIVIQDYIDETFKEGGLDRLEQLYTELFIESKVSNVTNACLTQALSLIENNIQKHLRDNPFILNTDPHIDELLKNLTNSITCQKIYKLYYFTETKQDYDLSQSHYMNLPFTFKWQLSYNYPEQVYVSVDNANDPDCRKKNALCFGYLYNYPMADSADLRVIAELTYNYNLTLVHKLKEYILFFFNDYWKKRDSSEGLAIWEKEMSTEELIEFRQSDKYKALINELINIIMHPGENRFFEVKIPKYKYDDFITRQTQVDLKIDELRKFVNECCINYCLADLLNQIFLKFKKAFNYDLEEEYYVFRNFKYVHSLFGLALEIDNFFNDNHNIAKVLPEHNIILFPDIKLIFSSIKEFYIDKDDYTRAIEKRNEVFNMFSKYIQQISLFEQRTQSSNLQSEEVNEFVSQQKPQASPSKHYNKTNNENDIFRSLDDIFDKEDVEIRLKEHGKKGKYILLDKGTYSLVDKDVNGKKIDIKLLAYFFGKLFQNCIKGSNKFKFPENFVKDIFGDYDWRKTYYKAKGKEPKNANDVNVAIDEIETIIDKKKKPNAKS